MISLFFQTSHNNSLSILDILSKNQLLIIFIFFLVSLFHFIVFFFFCLLFLFICLDNFSLTFFTCRSSKTSKLVMRNHSHNNIHLGIYRRPTAVSSDFCLFISCVCDECYWKSDHYHSHIHGFSS